MLLNDLVNQAEMVGMLGKSHDEKMFKVIRAVTSKMVGDMTIWILIEASANLLSIILEDFDDEQITGILSSYQDDNNDVNDVTDTIDKENIEKQERIMDQVKTEKHENKDKLEHEYLHEMQSIEKMLHNVDIEPSVIKYIPPDEVFDFVKKNDLFKNLSLNKKTGKISNKHALSIFEDSMIISNNPLQVKLGRHMSKTEKDIMHDVSIVDAVIVSSLIVKDGEIRFFGDVRDPKSFLVTAKSFVIYSKKTNKVLNVVTITGV